MTSAPVRLTGPAADAHDAHDTTLHTLREAAGRSAELLRRVDNGAAPVPGLAWTAAETAAHMIGELRDYTLATTRYTNGYVTHANRMQESPSRMGAVVNARQLTEVAERDMATLATMLEGAVVAYRAAAAVADEAAGIPTANGLVLRPSTMTSLLLGEQLVHGLDIARATRTRWDIRPHDALMVIPGALSVAPQYLRRSALTVRASFELRIWGANGYRMAVDHGTAIVTDAGEKADCVITADPVAFLLLGYGRISQWSPILRGRLRARGRKPWLAMKFATLLDSP
jgi:hypothetical protein